MVPPITEVGDIQLQLTTRLSACTLGSAPGTMLSNEYGKPLPLQVVQKSRY